MSVKKKNTNGKVKSKEQLITQTAEENGFLFQKQVLSRIFN